MAETNDGYTHQLRAVGHLREAKDDEPQKWPELHAAMREARKRCQAAVEMSDWQVL